MLLVFMLPADVADPLLVKNDRFMGFR